MQDRLDSFVTVRAPAQELCGWTIAVYTEQDGAHSLSGAPESASELCGESWGLSLGFELCPWTPCCLSWKPAFSTAKVISHGNSSPGKGGRDFLPPEVF